MPTTSTQKIVVQKFFNDLASPVTIAGATWGPTDGHYLIRPKAAGSEVAIEVERISTLLTPTGAVAPASADIIIALNAAGNAVLWSGSLTLLDKGGGLERLGFVYPKQIMASADIPAAVQTILSTQEGDFYIQIKADVEVEVLFIMVDYSLHESDQPSA